MTGATKCVPKKKDWSNPYRLNPVLLLTRSQVAPSDSVLADFAAIATVAAVATVTGGTIGIRAVELAVGSINGVEFRAIELRPSLGAIHSPHLSSVCGIHAAVWKCDRICVDCGVWLRWLHIRLRRSKIGPRRRGQIRLRDNVGAGLHVLVASIIHLGRAAAAAAHER
jgi:hypothetical protein